MQRFSTLEPMTANDDDQGIYRVRLVLYPCATAGLALFAVLVWWLFSVNP